MRWRDVGGRRYLVRVSTRGAERSLGLHGDSTQAMFDAFHTREAAAQARLSSMRTALLKRSEARSIAVLQRANKTFRVRRDKLETAVNDAGFEIDVIRRMQAQGDPHPLRLSDDENDFWAVQANQGGAMASSPKFAHMVVSPRGRWRTCTPCAR